MQPLSTALYISTSVGCGTSVGYFGGVYIQGGTSSYYMQVLNNSTLTANRTLTITTGDAARAITLSGDVTLSGSHSGTSSGTNTGDQTIPVTSVAGRTGAVTIAQADVSGLTTGSSPAFAGLTVNGYAPWTSNTLDYETGTWTPAIAFVTTGDLNVVYSVQSGRYTRIGRMVLVEFVIATSTFTFTTTSGNASITGLPFSGYGTVIPIPIQNLAASPTMPTNRNFLWGIVSTTSLNLTTTGVGIAYSYLAAAQFTSGTQLNLRMAGMYSV